MHIVFTQKNEIPDIDGRTSVVVQQLKDGAKIPDGAIQVNLDDLPSQNDRWRWKLDGDRVVVDKTKKIAKATVPHNIKDYILALMEQAKQDRAGGKKLVQPLDDALNKHFS